MLQNKHHNHIQERFTFLFSNGSVPCEQFLRGKSRIGQESCMWSSRKQQSISIVLDLLKHWFKHHQVSNKPSSQDFPNIFPTFQAQSTSCMLRHAAPLWSRQRHGCPPWSDRSCVFLVCCRFPGLNSLQWLHIINYYIILLYIYIDISCSKVLWPCSAFGGYDSVWYRFFNLMLHKMTSRTSVSRIHFVGLQRCTHLQHPTTLSKSQHHTV